MMSFSEHNGVVWKRSTNCSESDEDVWDDRALITAYDRAVNQVNAKLINKHISQNINNGLPSNANQQKQLNNWRVGQYCRCSYSEDGVEYEAKIISMNPQNDSVIVRYIGYDNEETKTLNDLKRSLGKNSRKAQKRCCNIYSDTNSDTDTELASHSAHNQQSSTTSWFEQTNSNSDPNSMPKTPLVPPPLPFPQDSNIPSDEESLASMLMSWYMSGYHTGYYRALKQSRLNCKCHQN